MGIISYAQNFEDVMLWRALGAIEKGFYIDIGSQHPTIDSVSRAFYDHGWKGIHVEPTKFYADLLRLERPEELVIQAAVAETGGLLRFYEIPNTGLSTASLEVANQHRAMGFTINESLVTAVTLDDVFETLEVNDVHWLKIDVEGFEKEILLGWKKSVVRPWVVVIESTFPNSQRETHEGWESLLLEKGYTLAYVDGLNRFYIFFACENLKPAFKFGPNVFDGYQLASCVWSVGNLAHKYDGRIEELDASRRSLEMQVSLLVEQAKVTADATSVREDRLSTEASLAITSIREELQATLHASARKIEDLRTEISTLSAQLIAEKDLRINEVAEKELALRQQGNEIRSEFAATLKEHIEREQQLRSLMHEQAKSAEELCNAQAEDFRQREKVASDRLANLQLEMLRNDEIRKAQAIEVERRCLQEVGSLKKDLEGASRQVAELEVSLEIANERCVDAEKQLRAQEQYSSEQLAQARAETIRALEHQADQFRIREEMLASTLASVTDSLATSEQRATIRDEISSASAEDSANRLGIEISSLKQVIYDQIQIYRRDISRLEAASNEQSHRNIAAFRERDAELLGELGKTRGMIGEMANQSMAHHSSMQILVKRYEDTCSTWTNEKKEERGKLQAAALVEQGLRNELAVQLKRIEYLRRRLEQQKLPFWKRAMTREVEDYTYITNAQPKSEVSEAMESLGKQNSISQIHSIDDLLDLDGGQLIYSAYQAFLGREPDEKGATYYARRLASGFSKESVVLQISTSDEARQARRSLEGFEEFSRNYSKGNHWFFRYFWKEALQERQLRRIQHAVETMAQRLMDLEIKLHRRLNLSEDALVDKLTSIEKDLSNLHANVSDFKVYGINQYKRADDYHLKREIDSPKVTRELRTTLEIRAQPRLDN